MKFTPTKLAIASALAISSLSLTGCMTTDNSISTVRTMEQNAPVIREFNEALSEKYSVMREQQISDVAYELYFNLDNKKKSYNGKTLIEFNLSKGNKSPVTVDFDSGTVDAVKVNGKTVAFDYEKWFITIDPSVFNPGKNAIEIVYNRPYETDGSGLHRFEDPANGDVYLYSDFQPYAANQMFPHFDQPNLKATFNVKVDAPSHWQIISTTRETKIIEKDGVKHWDFPISAKISSYVFALHAGKYTVWEDVYHGKTGDVPLRLFARQSMAEYVNTEEWFTPTKQSFKFFNNYFEIPYPFGKYDQVMVPDYNSGAMENVAAVTFNESFISRGAKTEAQRLSLADTIAHEMAHMWFGDLVTMDWWNGLWLNESFASYMAVLALEKGSDFENVWDDFYTGFKQWAYSTDRSVNTHAIELPVATTREAMEVFDGITYGKGASVLKQVPKYLGEENFLKGVSNYLKKYSYKNTTLNDFITSLAEASNTDLTQWTQDWLYKAGLNTIEVSYQCNAGVIDSFAIKQTAPEKYPTLRQQRVNVGLFNYDNGTMTLTDEMPVTYKGAMTDVAAMKGKQCPDLVYPNLDDWGYVQVNLDKRSLATLNKHINDFESPSLRLMLWQSLSDSVNDAQLSPATFVDFALANLEGEKDLNVIRSISGKLSGALGYLSTATQLGVADFNAKRNQVNDFYFTQLKNAQAGSDLQQLWFGRFLSTTRTPAQLAKLEDILDGKLSFDGLKIDQDKRWRIVRTLNHRQVGDYKARLAAEVKRDKSDLGAKNAILAEVLRPDPRVKEKWFDIIINNPDNLKLATLRYAMWGIFPGNQKALEAPYKERILAHIEKLNDEGNLMLLGAFAGSMLPTSCTAESHQELGELVDKYKDMKPQVLKGVKRSHQEIGRCVKVLELLK